MPHFCQQCGNEVEQGVPFCPKCGAPQIRVSAPVSQAQSEVGVNAVASDVHSGQPAGVAQSIDRHYARSIARLVAFILALVMLVPYVSLLFPIWIPLAGALTVRFYRRGRPGSR